VVPDKGEAVDIQNDETAQKLLKALMQFKRAGWHQTSPMGYKPSELRVLFCLGKGLRSDTHELEGELRPDMHEMKVSEISKRLHVTPPTVTQLIKGLEASGLVERNIDPVDRRAVGIKLTEKGEKITSVAVTDFLASITGLIEYLGEEESDQFAELLVKVSRYYTEKAASADFAHWSGDEER
jgi:DNA-binding MarR family transcriptional regulator